MSSTDPGESLDPLRKLSDLAKIEARLAEPFAEQQAILLASGMDAAALEAARSKWRVELATNPALPRLFSAIFVAERARVRGTAQPPIADPDGTAIASPGERAPALPFQSGDYRPEPMPIVTKHRTALDIDATVAATPAVDQTLPFGRSRSK
jgi:hypothetical protein